MLTEDDIRRIHEAVIAGKLRPTGLPLNRVRLELLRLMQDSISPMDSNGLETWALRRPQRPNPTGPR